MSRASRLLRGGLALAAVACLASHDSGSRASAQASRPRRLVWHGRITDERSEVGRAKSAGDVPRLPNPAIYAHSVKVDYEYVQQVEADGSISWPKRHVTWAIDGITGDDTSTETCHGGGSVDLSPARDATAVTAAERAAMRATCATSSRANAFRLYGSLPTVPPLPVIPGIDVLDDHCAYREQSGTRRVSVWLTPEVDAIVEMDATPGTAYQQWVPEPGRTLQISARTLPAFPAQFRFVIDPQHTSRFFGYAGNATIGHSVWVPDTRFFERFHLQHLEGTYTDDSPDLIFDPQQFDARTWKVIDQGTVETVGESAGATATVTAMDYGAIGQVRAFAKYKCGGWVPALVRVNGTSRDSLSVPLDEDHNLIADSLPEYNGDPGRDDDDDPEGDGTRGDGLTAFEEYRGFLAGGADCQDRLQDVHRRTSPRRKNLFVADGVGPEVLLPALAAFDAASGLSTVPVCTQHFSMSGPIALGGPYSADPSKTRIVNFTLPQADQRSFEGHTITRGAQHGVLVRGVSNYSDYLGPLDARAVPVTEGWSLGPPVLTNFVAVNFRLPYEQQIFALVHELGHVVGIPHHSDSREGWRLVVGIENVIPEWSPLQAVNVSLQEADAGQIIADAPSPDALLVAPGEHCTAADPAAAYRDGAFAGCLTPLIIRRGQQNSGPVSCPMRYQTTGFYEPAGGRAVYGMWTGFVTDDPSLAVTPADTSPAGGAPTPGRGLDSRAEAWQSQRSHTFYVDLWTGPLLHWPDQEAGAGWGTGRFCDDIKGTDVNASTRPDNLAGDEGRKQPCRSFIVVNDLAIGGAK